MMKKSYFLLPLLALHKAHQRMAMYVTGVELLAARISHLLFQPKPKEGASLLLYRTTGVPGLAAAGWVSLPLVERGSARRR